MELAITEDLSATLGIWQRIKTAVDHASWQTSVCHSLAKECTFNTSALVLSQTQKKIKKKVQGSLNAVKLQIIRNKAWKYLNNEKWDTAAMPM